MSVPRAEDRGKAGAHQVSKDHGGEDGPYETFDRLLRTEFDQLRPSEEHSEDVGRDIVHDDEGGGDPEPDETLRRRRAVSTREGHKSWRRNRRTSRMLLTIK